MLANFKLADLVAPLKWTEARDWITSTSGKLGISVTTWNSDSAMLAFVVSCSSMFEALSELQAEAIAGGFLEHARGPWLRMLARYVYGVEPEDATFATGDITLTNQGGGLYELEAGDVILRNASTGKTYRNVAGFSLGSNSVVTVTFMAQEVGAASNANTGEISEFVTVLNRVVASNATALIARDEESPAELKARCREKLGSLSPFGPWDAYSYAARTAKLPSGQSIGITRTRVTKDGYGNVFLCVATASGGVTGEAELPDTAIGAIDAAVGRMAEPLGVTAQTRSADAIAVTVAYTAWVWNTSGLSVEAIRARVAAALAAYFATYPIGGNTINPEVNGSLFREALTAVIHNALPEIYLVELGTPAVDVELEPTDVIVLAHNPNTHGTINVTPRPEGLL